MNLVLSLVCLISFWIIVYHGGVLEAVVEEVDVGQRMNEPRKKQHGEVTKRSHGIGRSSRLDEPEIWLCSVCMRVYLFLCSNMTRPI
jgi:hypothetical protein